MAEKFDVGRIVLIHGAAHGAWCWEEVVPLLRARGFEVTAPDLPGLGADTTPPKDVTMESYIQRIVEAVGDIGPPVLLVGHSMGGLPISEAAERIPSRISKLIYLTAVLPQSGEKLTDFTEVNEGESSAALALIDSRPGLQVGVFAEELGVHQSTASNMLEHLARQGLVEKRRNGEDQRAVSLLLTARAKTILKSAPQANPDAVQEALNKLPPSKLAALQERLSELIRTLPAGKTRLA